MPQGPDWKRFLEVGMQFTEMRRSQAQQIARDLAEQGQLARDQMSNAVDEIVAMSRRRSEELGDVVRKEVQRQLGSLGLATKADLAKLERKINATAKTAKKANKAATAKKAPAAKKKPAAKKPAKRAG